MKPRSGQGNTRPKTVKKLYIKKLIEEGKKEKEETESKNRNRKLRQEKKAKFEEIWKMMVNIIYRCEQR